MQKRKRQRKKEQDKRIERKKKHIYDYYCQILA